MKLLIFALFVLCHSGCISCQKESDDAVSYFFPGFPFPPGLHPRDLFPRWPNIRFPSTTRRPSTRPDARERCPDEGLKMIAHPKNCEMYIVCIDGKEVTEMTCADGLHFSRITRSCVDARAAGCETMDWSCPEKDEPGTTVFLPNKEDCSSYFICFSGNKIPMRCSSGQHWSIFENNCMNPEEAKCQFSAGYLIKSASKVKENYSTAIKPFGTCPPSGVVSIPNPNSCEEFFLCWNGMQIEQQCQPGLHFSPTLATCAPPEVAQCVLGGCPSNGIAFLPHDDDCTKYYLCFNGIRNEMSCTADMHWSPTENRCMDPKEAGCKNAGHIECPATGIEQIPHPEDCDRFILCLNGMEVPLACAPGLHFSPSTRTCMQPDQAECEEPNEYKCPEKDTPGVTVFIPNTEDCNAYYLCWQGSQIPLTCRAGEHWSKTEHRCMPAHLANCPWSDGNEKCPEEGVVPIPHPVLCERYILCVNGHEVERDCQSGLHFSRELRNCVHPALANCRTGVAFELPTNGTCPVMKTSDDYTFVGNKEDCSSYYVCTKDQTKLFNCAKGLHFDVASRKCMEEAKAECIAQ